MKLFRKGQADSFSGKSPQSTDVYYKRGWKRGEEDRKFYDRGLADGLAGKIVRYRLSSYRRGWREGNRQRLEKQ
ncbi:MAG: hypothetical protein U0930_20100 [Pirellulales bacterium]